MCVWWYLRLTLTFFTLVLLLQNAAIDTVYHHNTVHDIIIVMYQPMKILVVMLEHSLACGPGFPCDDWL